MGLAGCIGGDDDDDGDTTDDGTDDGGGTDESPIVIGSLQEFTGAFPRISEENNAGAEWAIEKLNENGGVLDREIELDVEDSGSDPREGDTLFQRFVEEENVSAVIGPVSSDVGVRISQTAEELEVPLFLNRAGDHQILTRDSRYTFRTNLLPGPASIEADAELVQDEGFTQVGAIIADYAWGRAIEDAIAEFIEPLDGVETHIEVAPPGEDDFSPYIRSMPDDLELLIASSHPMGTPTIVSNLIELDQVPEMVTGANEPGENLWDALGEDMVEGNLVDWRLIDPEDDDFVELAEEYNEETGERMTTDIATGYSTVMMIAEAIESAGSAAPGDVADEMREIEYDGLWSAPVSYTEWGELDGARQVYVSFEAEAPDYYPDGEWRLNTEFVTDPLDPLDPDDWD
ncbi:ABC transporter substrate-binding protein [Natrarchaeobius chitinivorans]|uniref:ABC transporter substrate-binding protein n=1 Tax=Natrarchaeobius chitinivorans TaxID=1679083 RepID=UPI001404D4B5|nr:ABC transporter substrate-binding protein [Natrarchaeobius chitinivorans]